MDEISNKTLAILLIAAIVISLGGTLISLNRLARIKIPIITGLYGLPEEAIVQFDISALVQVNFTTDTIDWGSGTVATGYGFCVLNSYSASIDANCSTFTPQTAGLVLENIGNKNVTLNITMQKNAASFITGTGPVCQWNVSNKEPNSCPGIALTLGSWQTCATTAVVVCNSTGGGFLATDTSDTLHFDALVQIPSDALSGAKTNVMTASAAQI